MREQLEHFLNENAPKGILSGRIVMLLVGEQACNAEDLLRKEIEAVWQFTDLEICPLQEGFKVSSLEEMDIEALRDLHERCEEWVEDERTVLYAVAAAESANAAVALEVLQVATQCRRSMGGSSLICGLFVLLPEDRRWRSRQQHETVKNFFAKLYAMQAGQAAQINAWLEYQEDEEPQPLDMELNAAVFLLERIHTVGSGSRAVPEKRQLEPLVYLLNEVRHCVSGCYVCAFSEENMPREVKIPSLLAKRMLQLIEEEPEDAKGELQPKIRGYVMEYELRREEFLEFMKAVRIYRKEPKGQWNIMASEETETEYFGNWLSQRFEKWQNRPKGNDEEIVGSLLNGADDDRLASYVEELGEWLAVPPRKETAAVGRGIEVAPYMLWETLVERRYLPEYENAVNQRLVDLAEKCLHVAKEQLSRGNITYSMIYKKMMEILSDWKACLAVEAYQNNVEDLVGEQKEAFQRALDAVLSSEEMNWGNIFRCVENDPGMNVSVDSFREWSCQLSGHGNYRPERGTEPLKYGSRKGQKLEIYRLEKEIPAAERLSLVQLTIGARLK